jgi:D-xylono/L-arabinono-1,4-lactonase
MKSKKSDIQVVCNEMCHLGEGPIWHVDQQKLYWTDIYNRRIWVYETASKQHSVFWQGDCQVGGFAFTKMGGMVLCTDKGVFIIRPEQMGECYAIPYLLFEIPFKKNEIFNDITVDPKGRIFAGTLDREHLTGDLYLLEKNKKPKIVLRGISCSNGMAFSINERFFFHTDTLKKRITRYSYERQTGQIKNPEVFFQGDESLGLPDGITLDSDDCLWIAFWGGSAVRRIDSTGNLIEEISLPVKQPSSVMFGGHDLRNLYITSSYQGADDMEKGLDKDGAFLGGPLYLYRTQVSGRAEWLADFD